jgi:hypothetical protein
MPPAQDMIDLTGDDGDDEAQPVQDHDEAEFMGRRGSQSAANGIGKSSRHAFTPSSASAARKGSSQRPSKGAGAFGKSGPLAKDMNRPNQNNASRPRQNLTLHTHGGRNPLTPRVVIPSSSAASSSPRRDTIPSSQPSESVRHDPPNGFQTPRGMHKNPDGSFRRDDSRSPSRSATQPGTTTGAKRRRVEDGRTSVPGAKRQKTDLRSGNSRASSASGSSTGYFRPNGQQNRNVPSTPRKVAASKVRDLTQPTPPKNWDNIETISISDSEDEDDASKRPASRGAASTSSALARKTQTPSFNSPNLERITSYGREKSNDVSAHGSTKSTKSQALDEARSSRSAAGKAPKRPTPEATVPETSPAHSQKAGSSAAIPSTPHIAKVDELQESNVASEKKGDHVPSSPRRAENEVSDAELLDAQLNEQNETIEHQESLADMSTSDPKSGVDSGTSGEALLGMQKEPEIQTAETAVQTSSEVPPASQLQKTVETGATSTTKSPPTEQSFRSADLEEHVSPTQERMKCMESVDNHADVRYEDPRDRQKDEQTERVQGEKSTEVPQKSLDRPGVCSDAPHCAAEQAEEVTTKALCAEEVAAGQQAKTAGSDQQDALAGQTKDTARDGSSGAEVQPPAADSAVEMRPAAVNSPQFAALNLSKKVERVLGGYLEEYRSDNEYWTKHWLKRARLSHRRLGTKGATSLNRTGSEAAEGPKKPYNFKALQRLPVALEKVPLNGPLLRTTLGQGRMLFEVEQIQRKGTNGKALKSKYSVKVSTLNPNDDMPPYAHYVSITANILSHNNRSMLHWPYFEDDFNYDQGNSIEDQYDVDILPRRRKLDRLQRAHALESYAASALQALGITWADVLRFLLDPIPDVGTDPDALRAFDNRAATCEEDFSRDHERSVKVLSSLPLSTPEKLAKAAALCDNFLTMANISLWHIARLHQFEAVPKPAKDNVDSESALDRYTCRVCMRFACPYHGTIEEHEGGEEDDGSEPASDCPVALDIVHPPAINYRTRIAFTPAVQHPTGADQTAAQRRDRRTVQYWQNNYKFKPEELRPFEPCHHPGKTCDQAHCSCYENGIPCEKSCSCPQTCHRKFQGCSCVSQKLRKGLKPVCFEDERCICYALYRECDPDLCGSCGVCEVLDPVNRYNEEICKGRCKNAGVQRGVPKRTLIGKSIIHGFGLYAGEHAETHDFMGEYKGEIITRAEAERRGAVYEHQKLSYLFSLNEIQEIDSTYFGNKIRFINHASRNFNLYPRIVTVNTIQRIALFANKSIRSGEELFFDYGPQFPDEQLGGAAAKKSSMKSSGPRVHNSTLIINETYDVQSEQDEDGTRRATKGAKLGNSNGSRQRQKKDNNTGNGKSAATKQPTTGGVGGSKSSALKSASALIVDGAGDSPSADGMEEDAEDHEAEGEEEAEDDGMQLDTSPGGRLKSYYLAASDEEADRMEVDNPLAVGAGAGAVEAEIEEDEEEFRPEEDSDGNLSEEDVDEGDLQGKIRPRRRRGRPLGMFA